MLIECHIRPWHRVNEDEVLYYHWRGGGVEKGERDVLGISASFTKEPIEGSVPVCLNCVEEMKRLN